MLRKIIIVISVLIAIFACFSNTTHAMDNVISSGDGFLASANNEPVIDEGELKKTSDYIYNILFVIAVVLAVAIGMIIGIQFMFGSVEEQAKVKETLVPYVIGVFVVFASFTIWKIAVNIGNEVAPTPEATGTSTTAQTDYCKSCGNMLNERGTVTRVCGVCNKNADTFSDYCGKCGNMLNERGTVTGKCGVCEFNNK